MICIISNTSSLKDANKVKYLENIRRNLVSNQSCGDRNKPIITTWLECIQRGTVRFYVSSTYLINLPICDSGVYVDV